MLYDLHTHTNASDGILTSRELIDKAVQTGLAGIAVTDHDTVAGIQEALDYQKKYDSRLEVIPGIEMNTENEDCEVHILGYYIDHRDSILCNRLKELKESRLNRAVEMVKKLRAMGYNITFEQIRRIAQNDLIARPHIARALVQNNNVFSIKEAFDKLIGRGKPAYVPRYKFLPEEALNMIKSSGGIAVLAHPGLIKNQLLIDQVIAAGIEGIEIYYPEHKPEQIEKYIALALRHNLLITGGSDYHGLSGEKVASQLGCCGISAEQMQKIRKYYGEKRQK
ncbi:MAG TPA: PHP domain-containing protein [Syntrophomonadaceae bacterium]|nr:PHP domain-containing protein [Syntrophomonadaceae bacterium]HNX28994.1 PHP domain-containing protein [Syntrophomonadaceae bacterium]HPR93750.1 PHP domain-containing protein [Syntrophomonadaceae bacterium]